MLDYCNYIGYMCLKYGTWIYNKEVEFIRVNNCISTI